MTFRTSLPFSGERRSRRRWTGVSWTTVGQCALIRDVDVEPSRDGPGLVTYFHKANRPAASRALQPACTGEGKALRLNLGVTSAAARSTQSGRPVNSHVQALAGPLTEFTARSPPNAGRTTPAIRSILFYTSGVETGRST